MPTHDDDETINMDEPAEQGTTEMDEDDSSYPWESGNGSPDLDDDLMRTIEAYDSAPFVTHIERLERVGVKLPPPEALSDDELSARLWEIINALAGMRTFIHGTNHMSDRELYTQLLNDALREDVPDIELGDFASNHLDLSGSSGNEEDTYLRYYADEETRERWMKDFPDTVMPPHENPPYDRDRTLPKAAHLEPPDDEGDMVM
jgi:hypothetical protein